MDEPAFRRSPVVALLGVDLLARTSYGLCRTPLLPLWAASQGAGPAQIGMVGAAATLTGLVVKFPAGTLSDVVGRGPLLAVGLAVFASGPWLYPLAGGIAALVLVRLFHGMATAVYGPVSMAAMAGLSGARRGEMLSWLSNTKIAGSLLGALLGGWILSYAAGDAAEATDRGVISESAFRWTWVVAAALGGCALVCGMLVVAGGVSGGNVPSKKGAWTKFTRGLRATARNGPLILVSSAEGLQNLSVGMLEQFLPIYAVLVAGLSPFQAGVLFGVQIASTIACKPLFGRLADRRGGRALVFAGLLVCAAPFAALPWTTSFPALLALAFVFGVGEALVTSAASALASDVAERDGLGAAMGAFGTIGDAGHAAGPILGGLLLAAAGWAEDLRGADAAAAFRPAFALVAALLVVVAIAFARATRPRPVTWTTNDAARGGPSDAGASTQGP